MVRNTNCRLCRGTLQRVLSFGNMPITNYFPLKSELAKEKKFPLEFCVCGACGLVQLGFLVDPLAMFDQYHFLTSASEPLVRHLESLAEITLRQYNLPSGSKILDIGCNDASLLLHYKKRGMKTLGVEPSVSLARRAKQRGIEVLPKFFTKSLARQIKQTYGVFDCITATRVLANVVALHDFMEGVRVLLSSKGIFIAEVSSLSEMLAKFQFDAIYHEHYSYFSVATVQKLFTSHGLRIVAVEKTTFQGGELRIFARQKTSARLGTPLTYSQEAITRQDFLMFAKRVRQHKKRLRDLFNDIKGARVVGFGAPAKGVTLLNYCNIGKDSLSFIVDSTPLKQGRFLPGLHIPIFPEAYLWNKNVDYVLLLAWNYKDDVFKKLQRFLPKKTTVIVPFPTLSVFSL